MEKAMLMLMRNYSKVLMTDAVLCLARHTFMNYSEFTSKV